MEKLSDLVTWVLGALLTLTLFAVRRQTMTTDEKFRTIAKKLDKLDDEQDDAAQRLAKVETKMDTISKHYLNILDELKTKQDKTYDEVTEIKVLLAAIPKRKGD